MSTPEVAEGEQIRLTGSRACVVLERRGTELLWRHWGARVEAGPTLELGRQRPRATFSLDEDLPPSLADGFGAGRFGPAVLRAHRDGRDFTFAATAVRVTQTRAALEVASEDALSGLTLTQILTLDAHDVLTLQSTLRNDGSAPVQVEWLAAAALPLPPHAAEILSFSGRHGAEFAPHREPMPAHEWRRETVRGLTGHGGPPGVFASEASATRHTGEVFAAQLAWSGPASVRIAHDDEGGWSLQLGEAFAPGEVRLAPGETLASPEALATWSDAGLNGASQNFHAAIRGRMNWPGGAMRPRPVHLNSWEGFYFDHDTPRLKALADRAAALGAERFVLDDGWFRNRRDDRAGLGDWTPDPVKYPGGLAELAAHVTRLGLEFGLWVEPEMVNPDSELFRAHPGWALQVAGRPLRTARNQLVLDLGRPDVREHLWTVLDDLLRTLPIGYLKWDHNRDLAPAGGADERAAFRTQVLGAYALLDRIRAAHPSVEIEACAGGGGRIDAGIATRTHRFWTSDNIDALSRVGIQRGFLAFMPPELMGAHVGASPAHATGRRQSMAFRAAVALPGHLGVELDPGRISDTDTSELAAWIARYKDLRDRLHGAPVWLGEAPDGVVWQAHGTAERLLLMVYRVEPTRLRRPPAVRLPMLAGRDAMRVRLLEGPEPGGWRLGEPEAFRTMRADGVEIEGAWLAAVGLPLPVMGAETCAIFEIAAAGEGVALGGAAEPS